MRYIAISIQLFGKKLTRSAVLKVWDIQYQVIIKKILVEAIAELIGTKSAEIAQRCIQDDYLNNNGTQKIKPRLKEGVYEDAECGRFLMHGPSMTKVR